MTDIVIPAREKETTVRDLEDLKRVIAHLTADVERPAPKPIVKVADTPAPRKQKTKVTSFDDLVAVTGKIIGSQEESASSPTTRTTPRPNNAGEITTLLSHLTGGAPQQAR